jgi:hypothetical protein
MSLQYVSYKSGRTAAVLVPIDDWNQLRIKHPDIDEIEGEIPQWRKDIIDQRMLLLKENAARVFCLKISQWNLTGKMKKYKIIITNPVMKDIANIGNWHDHQQNGIIKWFRGKGKNDIVRHLAPPHLICNKMC